MTLDHLREIALIQISQAQRTNAMNISFALISRAPKMGATLRVPFDGCKVDVSTVLFAGRRFTRAEADECEPCFYEGELDTYEAARRYIEGAPCVA